MRTTGSPTRTSACICAFFAHIRTSLMLIWLEPASVSDMRRLLDTAASESGSTASSDVMVHALLTLLAAARHALLHRLMSFVMGMVTIR